MLDFLEAAGGLSVAFCNLSIHLRALCLMEPQRCVCCISLLVLLQRAAAEPDLNTAEAQALPRTECVQRCFRKYGLSSYSGALLVLITSL